MSSSPSSPSSSGPDVERAAPGQAAAPAPLISYRGVNKAFDDKVVLKDIDLDVYEGETLVVMGRSGCGKTVLTSMIVGLNQPDAGSITVGGEDITKWQTDADWLELRLSTGYLFQGSALFDSMTVGENVAFPMVHHPRWSEAEIARRVHEKLEAVGLAEVENQDPAALSGGMLRRAALARALALDPRLVIYDEPTAGLDPITGEEIGRLILSLAETLKVTSVVVTHDLRLAKLVADRLTLLFEGRMVFLGTYEEFLQSDHPEVRRFLFQAAREANPDEAA